LKTLLPRLSLFVALAAIISFSATGCKTAPKKGEETVATEAMDSNTLGDSDSGKAMGLQTIHFGYDSFLLDNEAKDILKSNAQILKDNPDTRIQIEGHTDARGGIQYNIALGEKRANSVKAFLSDLGVKGDRITTISYGKERPLDQGTTDEAYAKNRRANFVITAR
jgi:peptidoglycan-associated lipoprotein